MERSFWIKRFVLALLVAVTVLVVVRLVKGDSATEASLYAAIWGVITAATYTLVAYFRYRRNPACMRPRQEQ